MCDCYVAFFTETWRSERQECFEMSSGGRLFLSGGTSRQGVGIGISARLRRMIEDVSFHAYSSRVCLLNCSICALQFSMLSVYFPTSWDDDTEIEAMYEILQLILTNIRRTGARIVILEVISMPMLGVFTGLMNRTSWDNGVPACGMLEVLH